MSIQEMHDIDHQIKSLGYTDEEWEKLNPRSGIYKALREIRDIVIQYREVER